MQSAIMRNPGLDEAQAGIKISKRNFNMLSHLFVFDSCDPIDCNLPGSCVHGIFQAIILEWIAIFFSRGLSDPGTKPQSPALQTDSTDQATCVI